MTAANTMAASEEIITINNTDDTFLEVLINRALSTRAFS